MSAPSPAPWHVVERNYGTWIDDAENHMIARVYITDLDAPDWEARLHADAELLASAPEVPRLQEENRRLRALLARFVAVTQGRQFRGGPEPMRAEELNEIAAEARAALGRGGEPKGRPSGALGDPPG